jgi:prolyl 4-hydroxylase
MNQTESTLNILLDSPQAELLCDENWIYTVDGLITPAECQRFIERTEAAGYSQAPITTGMGPVMAPHVRNNTRVMIDDRAVAASLWKRLRPWVPATLEGDDAVGLNERFRFYRYEEGQRFNWHLDGHYRRDHREASRLTVLLYLNGGCEGGATEFGSWHEIDPVRPAAGRMLVFQHRVEHRGAEVTRGRKYVMRTDVMYREPPLGL